MVGVLGAGPLEFDDQHGDAVQVQDDVEAPLDVVIPDGHLSSGDVLVVLDPVADDPDGGVVLDAVGSS